MEDLLWEGKDHIGKVITGIKGSSTVPEGIVALTSLSEPQEGNGTTPSHLNPFGFEKSALHQHQGSHMLTLHQGQDPR